MLITSLLENWWVYAIIFFLLLDFLVVAWIFFVKSKKKVLRPEELQYIRSHWIRIIDSFKGHTRLAILDADKLLDYALSKKGFQGNLGDKLKLAGGLFSNLDGLWRAHKLRNKIAHELTEFSPDEARSALNNFKKALNDLGANL